MSREPVLRLTGVAKAFRGRGVLCDVSLAVGAGQVLALMGHNGSGKTTLLRIVATTVLPDAGEVEIAGVDAVRDPVGARARLGVTLADERAWYWRLSGRQNLEFFAALHGLDRRAARAATGELLARVGLHDAGDQLFGEYSSGMRLRLSLARALLGQPRLLLLDEPTRSIDPAGADEFRGLIESYVRESGGAAVVASHDLEEVRRLSSQVLLLRVGEPPLQIEAPRTLADLRAAG
jgi:ABC-2 type transport system ATP-binding protein